MCWEVGRLSWAACLHWFEDSLWHAFVWSHWDSYQMMGRLRCIVFNLFARSQRSGVSTRVWVYSSWLHLLYVRMVRFLTIQFLGSYIAYHPLLLHKASQTLTFPSNWSKYTHKFTWHHFSDQSLIVVLIKKNPLI